MSKTYLNIFEYPNICQKCSLFWAKNPDFGPKIRFSSFPSYARFREGNPADAPRNLPPPHCEGTVCQRAGWIMNYLLSI